MFLHMFYFITSQTNTCTIEFSSDSQSWQCWYFVLSKYQNMPDTDVGQINLYSMHYDKCKSAYNLFT